MRDEPISGRRLEEGFEGCTRRSTPGWRQCISDNGALDTETLWRRESEETNDPFRTHPYVGVRSPALLWGAFPLAR